MTGTLLEAMLELQAAHEVPFTVARLYKQAADVAGAIADAVEGLSCQPGYGTVDWNPETKQAWISLGDSDEQATHDQWREAVASVPGVASVRSEAEFSPGAKAGWLRVKQADALGMVSTPFEWAGKLTGGPSPLSTSIVNSLLLGGLGYGGGALAEHLLPSKYVRRGRFRKTLGLLGAGLGAASGLPLAAANANNSAKAGQPLGWRSFFTPFESVPVNQGALDAIAQDKAGSLKVALSQLPATTPLDPHFVKLANDFASMSAGGTAPMIPVDAFNRAIWNDVAKGVTAQNNPLGTKSQWGDNRQDLHTPPAVGAAASGLVTGIQSMYGGRSLLSPVHFMRGLAAAGVDLATAHVAGGVLGALGGLTPDAQNTLQNMGLWGGLVRGTVGSIFSGE